MKKSLCAIFILSMVGVFVIALCVTLGCSSEEPPIEPEYTMYAVSHCRYYTDGTIITSDGMVWGYQTDTISDEQPYDGMPIVMCLDDNGTPDVIEDDIVLSAIYDTLAHYE